MCTEYPFLPRNPDFTPCILRWNQHSAQVSISIASLFAAGQ
jgi:hypothetical protein